MLHYPKEDTRKLFAKLPDLLREAMLSEETADNISKIAERNSIPKKDIPHLAELVGYILLGLLPPQNLPKTLQQDLGLDVETAKAVAQEVNRFILYPVKEQLAEFYKQIEFAPKGRLLKIKQEERKTPVPEPGVKPTSKQTPQAQQPKVQDIYREPIE